MEILGRDIIISLVVMSIILIIKYKNRKVVSLYNSGIMIFCIFIAIIFYLTGVSPISGFHLDIRINEISMIPFAGIITMLQSGIATHTIINIFGNIIMFVPIGFLTPLLCSGLDSYKKITLFGFATSFLIEFTQLFLIRGTDIDDLILNTFGTILGYFIFIIFKNIFYGFIEKNIEESKYKHSKYIISIGIAVPYIVTIVCGFYDRFTF